MLACRAGARRASTRAATPRAAPTATACWRGRRAQRASSAAGRCGGRTARPRRARRLRARRCVGTHDFTAFTPTETDHVRFERDVLARAGGAATGDAARVLDRGRRVHAPHEPRAGRHDARGRRRPPHASRTSSRAARAARPRAATAGARRAPRRTGLLPRLGRRGYDGGPSTSAPTARECDWRCCRLPSGRDATSCSPTTTGSRPTGLQALRRALLDAARRRAGGDRARRQPLGDGALDHDPAAAVGRGGRLRRRHGRLRDRRHARSTACGWRSLGLIEGFEAELVVSGINHGSNLGDDITYSGTVAAALEAIVLGLPGIAVSQQSSARELDFRAGARLRLRGRGRVHRAAGRRARGRAAARRARCSTSTCPAASPTGVEVARARQAHLPRRAGAGRRGATGGRRLYRIYGDASYERDETGTDLAAVAQGRIAVTPIHFDLTDRDGPRGAAALRPRAADRARRARARSSE